MLGSRMAMDSQISQEKSLWGSSGQSTYSVRTVDTSVVPTKSNSHCRPTNTYIHTFGIEEDSGKQPENIRKSYADFADHIDCIQRTGKMAFNATNVAKAPVCFTDSRTAIFHSRLKIT